MIHPCKAPLPPLLLRVLYIVQTVVMPQSRIQMFFVCRLLFVLPVLLRLCAVSADPKLVVQLLVAPSGDVVCLRAI